MNAPTSRTLLSALVICLLIGGARSAPARALRAKDPGPSASLLGLWKHVSAEYEGVAQPEEDKLNKHWRITADTITDLIGSQAPHGGIVDKWQYRLKPGPGPMEIDLITQLPNGFAYLSLVFVEEDKLTICLQSFPERGRPHDLVSRPNSGVSRFVFQRVKE